MLIARLLGLLRWASVAARTRSHEAARMVFWWAAQDQLSLRWRAARAVLVPVDLRIYSRWPAGCPGARVHSAIILVC